ncbi:MAG: hypothetical protein JWO54_607 [Candidatus Saccharibacteria bacterium]|nr:hypothetical protein [Candidatus Saccharibacteria bacterium]MDB5180847.1 hypothetical protein [Candidatus Saccharibacteria bacterium]
MAKESSASQRLTELQAGITARIERDLQKCAHQTEVGNFTAAAKLATDVAADIVELRRIMFKRVSTRRLEIQRAVTYYSAWLLACEGRLAYPSGDYESNSEFLKLKSARDIVYSLANEYWNTKEYLELVKKLDSWMLAASNHRIIPNSD